MKKPPKLIFVTLLVLLISACGTHVVRYDPRTGVEMNEAVELIDRLIMEQHKNWRPDFVEINNRYILLGYGLITQSRGASVVVNNNVVAGSGLSSTRASGVRVYYESTDNVVLYSWKRKLKQWYIVALVGKKRQHVLKTRDLDEAKNMVDALEVVLNEYKK